MARLLPTPCPWLIHPADGSVKVADSSLGTVRWDARCAFAEMVGDGGEGHRRAMELRGMLRVRVVQDPVVVRFDAVAD